MDFLKKDNGVDKKINGLLGYHGLSEWWLSTFSEQERDHIIKTFQPMGSSGDSLIRGEIQYSSQSAVGLLSYLSVWFKKQEDRSIAFRIIEKAEELLNETVKIFDLHFLYQHKIQLYYKHRELESDALETAIAACKHQIAIAPEAKKAFLKEYKGSPLPAHIGFEQLSIIEEKRSNFEEAIKVSNEALQQGWSGSWEKRIERCTKKTLKQGK